jgi:hypothetical protein
MGYATSTVRLDELLDERVTHRGWSGEDAAIDT